ncbi:MAG TPA: hypothetical protein VN445_05770 [Rectinemataceae bacterium]|nr:hypothetical protein [Rectinemataceae bacterium]
MKRIGIIALTLLMAFSAAASLGAQNAAAFNASKFPAWVESDGLWRTVVKTSFKKGAKYAPTDEELKVLAKLVSLTPTSTGKTDYLMVVLKDVNQQLDRGYYNAGIASGYLNLGAISLGHGTHFFMTTSYANAKYSPLTIEEAYLKDKGYKYTFGYDANKQGDAKGQTEAFGNLKFVCAIVIGTLDEKAESKVTDHGYPKNWVIAK